MNEDHIEDYILSNNIPNDISSFFKKSMKERYIFNYIISYIDTMMYAYIKYRRNQDSENVQHKVNRMGRILKHRYRYNYSSIENNYRTSLIYLMK